MLGLSEYPVRLGAVLPHDEPPLFRGGGLDQDCRGPRGDGLNAEGRKGGRGPLLRRLPGVTKRSFDPAFPHSQTEGQLRSLPIKSTVKSVDGEMAAGRKEGT